MNAAARVAGVLVCGLFSLMVGTANVLAQTTPQASQEGPRQTGVPDSGAPVRRLSLDEAVGLALEQNIDLQIERIAPQIQDEQVATTRAIFNPSLTSELAYNGTRSAPDSFLSGAEGDETLKTENLRTAAGFRQQLQTGGASYTLGWEGSRATTNSLFSNFNPRMNSNAYLSVTQPLLRNRSVDANRTQLIISRRNRDISDINLRAVVVRVVRSVKNAYWDLKFALANLDVQQGSLELAQQTLLDNRTRVRVGTMAPIDIVEAEAEVARNEEAVIVAEAAITQAEDQLRAIVFDPRAPEFWQMRINPIDAPRMDPITVDVEGAIQAALGKRTDLRRTQQNLSNIADNLQLHRNQMLPQVNLQADYSMAGLGGTQFLRGEGFPGPVVGTVTRGFGLGFPAWTVGLTVSYPLGLSTAEANFARTGLEQRQGLLQVVNIELQVGVQVRNLGRQVTTDAKRIEVTRAARVLTERRLDAEQRKFDVGTSTTFLVFQAQRELATARVNELRAILDFNQSLADFEAVQEASLSGPDITITSSSATVAGQGVPTTGSTTTQGANTLGR